MNTELKPIEVTSIEIQKVYTLESEQRIRGRRINTRIVYELWPRMFGVRKVPNGCGACQKSDMNVFLTHCKKLKENDLITVKTNETE